MTKIIRDIRKWTHKLKKNFNSPLRLALVETILMFYLAFRPKHLDLLNYEQVWTKKNQIFSPGHWKIWINVADACLTLYQIKNLVFGYKCLLGNKLFSHEIRQWKIMCLPWETIIGIIEVIKTIVTSKTIIHTKYISPVLWKRKFLIKRSSMLSLKM
jgi:hypothetical protein